MKITSKEANNMLRVLADNKRKILTDERQDCEFHAAANENADELRPDYDFAKVNTELEQIDNDVMKLKHAINVFNSTSVVGETGLTVDQILIKIAQLSQRKDRLDIMRVAPKKRRGAISGAIIDYVYTSYSPEDAQKKYNDVSYELKELQQALDLFNSTVTFDYE